MNRVHVTNPRPIFGLLQVTAEPGFGPRGSLRFTTMVKNPKDEAVERAIERQLTTIGENVADLMGKKIQASNKPRALADKAGVGKVTIQRLLKLGKGDVSNGNASTVSTLIRVAAALGVSLGYLLTPHDAVSSILDPTEYQGVEQVAQDLKSRRHRLSP